MNITVVGAGSTTASALIPMLLEETDAHLHLLSSKDIVADHDRVTCTRVDVTDRTQLKDAMMKRIPTTIVNAAAMTNVDACETDKKLAHTLNVTLVEHLTRIARQTDAHLVHMSTDYVFDGDEGPYTEDAIPAPINYYGKSKLAGENTLRSAGVDYAVVRTNVVYGPGLGRRDFVQWVIEALDDKREITVVTDQYGNPTYVDDLAEAMMKIIERRKTGTYHVGGADYVSRFEFAQKIAEFFMVDPKLIKPISTEELNQAARRPLKAGLITLKAESELQMRFRGVESGLVSIRHDMFSKARTPIARRGL